MNNTKLYIENQEVELNDSVQFLINKQFEDITNPTVIINDWSKTVEIPATQKNDELFSNIFSPDRVIKPTFEKNNQYKYLQEYSSAFYNVDFASNQNEGTVHITGKQGAKGTAGNVKFMVGRSEGETSSFTQPRNIKTQITSAGEYNFSFVANSGDNCIMFSMLPSSVTPIDLKVTRGSAFEDFVAGRTYYCRLNVINLTLGAAQSIDITYTLHIDEIDFNSITESRDVTYEGLNTVTTLAFQPQSSYYDTTFSSNTNESSLTLKGKSGSQAATFSSFEFQIGRTNPLVTSNAITQARLIENSSVSSVGTYEFDIDAVSGDNCIRMKFTGTGVTYYPYVKFVNGISYNNLTAGSSYHCVLNVTRCVLGSASDVDIEYTITFRDRKYNAKNFGVDFNPYKRMSFRLEWNDSVLMNGYAKLNEVVRKDTKTTYNVTLNGQLGNLFQEMKKITFDKSILNDEDRSEDAKYVISDTPYGTQQMTRDIVYDSWNNNRNDEHLDMNDALPYEIVGFAPSNAFVDDFDYKSLVVTESNEEKNIKFEDALPGDFSTVTKIEKSTAIGDGLKPRDIGEFRSYNQQPILYWDMFWQIFQKKAEELTGYNWILDSDWFDVNNPYWRNWCMTGKNFPVKPDEHLLEEANETYILVNNNNDTWAPLLRLHNRYRQNCITWQPNHYFTTQEVPQREAFMMAFYNNRVATSTPDDAICKNKSKLVTQNPKTWSAEQYFLLPVNTQLSIDIPQMFLNIGIEEGDADYLARFAETSPATRLAFDFYVYDIDTNETLFRKTKWMDNPGWYNKGEFIPSSSAIDPQNWANQIVSHPFIITPDNGIKIVNKLTRDRRLRMKIYLAWSTLPEKNYVIEVRGNGGWHKYDKEILLNTDLDYTVKTSKVDNIYRSYNIFDYNTLWNNDYKPFDFILNYCKMFRLCMEVDDFNKTLTFKSISKYLREGSLNGTYEDWTEKVDYEKEFKVTPISWENKYVKFNYDENELKDNKTYLEENGLNYGEKRIVTNYNFNDETTDLFTGLKQNVQYTPYVLSWNDLLNKYISYKLPKETYIENIDDDNKQKERFGVFGFVEGIKAFDASSNLRWVGITDDSDLEINRNIFCYNQSGNNIKGTLNYLATSDTLTDGSNTIFKSLFTQPNTTFTWDTFTPGNDIYDMFWRNYIDERYNKNNKKVTCYIMFTPEDFANFKHNKFVIVNNQLYFVNKIYDYDITTYGSTKVDLISVQNPSKYYKNMFDGLKSYRIISFPNVVEGYYDNIIVVDSNTTPTVTSSNVSEYTVTTVGDIHTISYNMPYTELGERFNITLNFGSEHFTKNVKYDAPFSWVGVELDFSANPVTDYDWDVQHKETFVVSSVESDSSWVSGVYHPYAEPEGDTRGYVTINLQENTTGEDRVAWLTVNNNQNYKMKIVQYGEYE